jgi:hypothetical protein
MMKKIYNISLSNDDTQNNVSVGEYQILSVIMVPSCFQTTLSAAVMGNNKTSSIVEAEFELGFQHDDDIRQTRERNRHSDWLRVGRAEGLEFESR